MSLILLKYIITNVENKLSYFLIIIVTVHSRVLFFHAHTPLYWKDVVLTVFIDYSYLMISSISMLTVKCLVLSSAQHGNQYFRGLLT